MTYYTKDAPIGILPSRSDPFSHRDAYGRDRDYGDRELQSYFLSSCHGHSYPIGVTM